MLRNLEELHRIQREVATRVILKDVFNKPITSVAGIDAAFLGDLAVLTYVIADYTTLEIKSRKTSIARLDFPYVPTLFSFREGPPIIDLIKSVEFKPDIFLLNSQGIAHPMLCGCASYIGVLGNVPTIGVAARKLCGEYDCEPEKAGEYVPLQFNEKAVGWVLKSKQGCRPIFISPGHLVSLKSSLDIVLRCIKNQKLPEPIYLAHSIANEEKKQLQLNIS